MPARVPGSRPSLSPALRIAGWCTALLVLALALAAGAAAWWVHRPLDLAQSGVEVSIEPGTSPREVARLWVEAGVRTSPVWLYEWFRWSGEARRIRAGSYEAGPGTTPRTLLAKMVQGDETLETVRIIEGWTVRQMRAALAAANNKDSKIVVFPEAGHGFHADYRPSYRAEEAADGWARLLALFEAKLKG